MPNLEEFTDACMSGSASASKLLGSIMGTMADVSGAVGFINMFAGLFPQTDALADAVRTLTQNFITALQDEFAGNHQLEVMEQVQTLLAQARSGVDLVKQASIEKRQLTDGESEHVRTSTDTTVRALGDDTGYWLRPYSKKAAYLVQLLPPDWGSDPDLSQFFLDPRESKDDTLVFDYRFTLPAYLEAIDLRLTALGATTPLSEPWVQDQLRQMADRLEWAHGNIVAAIVSLPQAIVLPITHVMGFPPRSLIDCEIEPDEQSHGIAWSRTTWKYEFGAVEKYSAFGVVERGQLGWGKNFKLVFPDPYLPRGDGAPPPGWMESIGKHHLAIYATRTLVHRKEVYRSVGLSSLFQSLNHLRQLGGQPTAQWDPGADWSIREVAGAIASTPLDTVVDPATYQPSTVSPLSVRDLLSLLCEDVLPIGLVEAFNNCGRGVGGVSSPTVPLQSAVTALGRFGDPGQVLHTYLFVVDHEGGVYSTFRDGYGLRKWFRLTNPSSAGQFTVPPQSTVSRSEPIWHNGPAQCPQGK